MAKMTISELAKEIGVSRSTISCVLTGTGRISNKTKAYVMAEVEKYGYSPNMNARRLRTGRTNYIGMPIYNIFHLDNITIELIKNTTRALRDRGYNLSLESHFTGWDDPELLKWVNSGMSDALLVVNYDLENRDQVIDVLSQDVLTVLVSKYPVENMHKCISIVLDFYSGAKQAVEYLMDIGHRNIGYIDIESVSKDPAYWGVQDTLKKANLPFGKNVVVADNPYAEDGEKALMELMRKDPSITAVICRTDMVAIGAERAAKKMGLLVPQALSVIGHDDAGLAQLGDPELTSINVNPIGLDGAIAETLMQLIDNPDEVVPPVYVPTTLTVRASTDVCAA